MAAVLNHNLSPLTNALFYITKNAVQYFRNESTAAVTLTNVSQTAAVAADA